MVNTLSIGADVTDIGRYVNINVIVCLIIVGANYKSQEICKN